MDPRQRLYLDAMGIQVWERREAPPTAVEVAAAAVPPAAPVAEEKAAPADMPARGTLEADDGIPAWLDEAPYAEPSSGMAEEGVDGADFFPEPAATTPLNNDVATLDWPALQERVAACTACAELVANRTQTVFGVGNQRAEWMVIGEAPGADEDAQGEPFVGKAGQLLNAMLNAVGLQRQQVYIANVLKCRPPNNRDPRPEEAVACEPFLKRQIALLQPRLILVVGRIAAQNLLKVDTPIGKLRGRVHRLEGGIPVVVTYHPAYLLRSPAEKRKAWADLCLARHTLQQAGE